MDEMIETINANSANAEAREKAEAERQAEALAEWREREVARIKAANRRADVKLGIRAVGFAGFIAGLNSAADAGLIAPVLWGVFLMFGFSWFGFHFGAWFQFRARKEDKLYG